MEGQEARLQQPWSGYQGQRTVSGRACVAAAAWRSGNSAWVLVVFRLLCFSRDGKHGLALRKENSYSERRTLVQSPSCPSVIL